MTMELPIINYQGESLGRTVAIAPHIEVKEFNPHVLYLEVQRYLSAQRQGTHKTKTRGQVRGSTKKLRKQKGTGSARIGDIKSPLLRGGGHAFAIQPRTYTKALNRKTKNLARKIALWQKIQEQRLIVVEDFTFDKPNTKQYIAFLNALSTTGKSLLVLNTPNPTVYRSSTNLPAAVTTLVSTLPAYDILHCDTLIIFEKALEELQNQLK